PAQSRALSHRVAVGDLQRRVQQGQSLPRLTVADGAGWHDVNAVEVDERQQTRLLARAGHGVHRGAAGSVRRQRLSGLAIGDEFDGPEHPGAAYVTDAGMPRGDVAQRRSDLLSADPAGLLYHAF